MQAECLQDGEMGRRFGECGHLARRLGKKKGHSIAGHVYLDRTCSRDKRLEQFFLYRRHTHHPTIDHIEVKYTKQGEKWLLIEG